MFTPDQLNLDGHALGAPVRRGPHAGTHTERPARPADNPLPLPAPPENLPDRVAVRQHRSAARVFAPLIAQAGQFRAIRKPHAIGPTREVPMPSQPRARIPRNDPAGYAPWDMATERALNG